MSEYGSGLTYGQTAMLDKERIKHAFRNELVAGEDENGFIYAPCSKEEAEAFILNAFDNAVYQALRAMTSGRAMERLLHEFAPDVPEADIFRRYMVVDAEESAKYADDYEFEADAEE